MSTFHVVKYIKVVHTMSSQPARYISAILCYRLQREYKPDTRTYTKNRTKQGTFNERKRRCQPRWLAYS